MVKFPPRFLFDTRSEMQRESAVGFSRTRVDVYPSDVVTSVEKQDGILDWH